MDSGRELLGREKREIRNESGPPEGGGAVLDLGGWSVPVGSQTSGSGFIVVVAQHPV